MIDTRITTLFLDVGGVLLTNGWDHHMREKAAQVFNLDYSEMNARHALTFDTYEIGKITLDQYLDRIVFYQRRNFTREKFKEFMYAQSEAYPDMIKFVSELKSRYGFKVVALSNEGKELMEKRIERFRMKKFVDFFVCSGFVHLRKPDEEIYHIAFNMAQSRPEEILYIDDRLMLVEIGRQLGMHAIHHIKFEQTQNLIMDLLSVTSTTKG